MDLDVKTSPLLPQDKSGDACSLERRDWRSLWVQESVPVSKSGRQTGIRGRMVRVGSSGHNPPLRDQRLERRDFSIGRDYRCGSNPPWSL